MPSPSLADRGRALTGRLAASSPHLKQRVAVVAVWVVASAASVAFAFSGGEHNPISARVNMVDTGFGTAFDLQNRSDAVWQDVTVVLQPGGWIHRRSTLRPGERLNLRALDFSRPSGTGPAERPDRSFEPQRLEIRTSTATYATDPRRKR